MPQHTRIYRPTSADVAQLQETREILQQTCDVLKEPMPDTFLGRTTRQPIQPRQAPSEALLDGPGPKIMTPVWA